MGPKLFSVCWILSLLALSAGAPPAPAQEMGGPPAGQPGDSRMPFGERMAQIQNAIGRFRTLREGPRGPDHQRRIDELLGDPKIPRMRRRLIDSLAQLSDGRPGRREPFMMRLAYEAGRNWLIHVEGRPAEGALSGDYHQWVMGLRIPFRRAETEELSRLVSELVNELEHISQAGPPPRDPSPDEPRPVQISAGSGSGPPPPRGPTSPATAAGLVVAALLAGIVLGGGGRRVVDAVTGLAARSPAGATPELLRCRDLMRLYSGSFHRLKNHLGLARRYDGDPEGLGEVLGDDRTRGEIRELSERSADELATLAARMGGKSRSGEADPATRLVDRGVALVTKVSSELLPRLVPERLRTLEELAATGAVLGNLAEEARQFSLELCAWSSTYMVDVQELSTSLIEGLPYRDCLVLGSPDGVDGVIYVSSASKWREGVKEALVNLADNAKQAGAKRIRMSWELAPGPRGRGTELILGVEDDAGGIPPELAGRVFSPHVSGREEGTGMGLPRVRQIAQNLGGMVDFRPALGGTRFEMRLPVLPSQG